MEALERQKYFQQRQQKIILSEKNLIDKQRVELEALQIKLNGRLNEELKRKEIEQQVNIQRYANVKQDMQLQQAHEKNKFIKTFQTKSTAPATNTQLTMMQSGMALKLRGIPQIVDNH